MKYINKKLKIDKVIVQTIAKKYGTLSIKQRLQGS